jgi:hypothetical protein
MHDREPHFPDDSRPVLAPAHTDRRTDREASSASARRAGWLAAATLAFALGVVPVAAWQWSKAQLARPLLPPPSTEVVVVHPQPNVLVAVRDLQRLESSELHFERVIDAKSEQTHLFGLVHADDALLLVAVGDVTAGVDLSELREGDVEVDWAHKSAKLVLPPAKVFSTRLDNEKTYVHSRSTAALAHRVESLESEARATAEKELAKAAQGAGILDRANANAAHTVENLVRALGFEHVEVSVSRS